MYCDDTREFATVKEAVPANKPPKQAVILYHKEIKKVYKTEWIDKCIRSLESQTYSNFDTIELSYGDSQEWLEEIISRKIHFKNHQKIHKPLKNHVHAMNFLLSYCFMSLRGIFESPYSVVFNTNLDDYYSKDRIERQLEYFHSGAELVASDFKYIEDDNKGSEVIKRVFEMSSKNLYEELSNDHNIICHPVVAYSKDFWQKYGPYKDVIPTEDLVLWKNAIMNGGKFAIVPKVLCNYRIHDKQITAKERKWPI